MARTRFALLALLACSAWACAQDTDDWSVERSWALFGSTRSALLGPDVAIGGNELERFADLLALDDTQRRAMASIVDAMEEERLQAWVRFVERRHDEENPALAERFEGVDVGEEYRDEMERLVESALEDLRLLVTPEQDERWRLIERERRRSDTLLRHASLARERVDLVEAVSTLGVDDPALGALLEEYAQEMDVALIARNQRLGRVEEAFEAWEAAERERDAAYEEGLTDDYSPTEAMLRAERRCVALAFEAREACERVARVNERHKAVLRDALPADLRSAFDELVRTEGNEGRRDHVGVSPMIGAFDRALSLGETANAFATILGGQAESGRRAMSRTLREVEPLTPERARAIKRLRDEFLAELKPLEAQRPRLEREDEDIDRPFELRTNNTTIRVFPKANPQYQNAVSFSGGIIQTFTLHATEDRATEAEETFLVRRGRLEHRYMEELRGHLTLRQRAVVALE